MRDECGVLLLGHFDERSEEKSRNAASEKRNGFCLATVIKKAPREERRLFTSIQNSIPSSTMVEEN
jgi:hypothetical protein